MVILFGGQKGGTGKSTIATNLAAFLAMGGREVLLIDGNTEQGTGNRLQLGSQA